jgi:hypothetical protein
MSETEEGTFPQPIENTNQGGSNLMCCRACHGYDLCQAQKKLRDDCCTQCTYFADCMESDADEDANPRNSAPARRYFKPRK